MQPQKLRQHINEAGPARTWQGIKIKARSEDVLARITKGYVPLNEVHPVSEGQKYSANAQAIKAARKDGVLLRERHLARKPYIVPEWWADQYALELGERLEAQRYVRANWLTTREVASTLGVHHCNVPRIMNGQRGPKELRNDFITVRSFTVKDKDVGVAYFWHPEDVEEVARKYRRYQAGEAY